MAKKRAHITDEHARDIYGDALDRLTRGKDQTTMQTTEHSHAKESLIKLSVFLAREEDAYLEELASTAKFSGGKKFSKTKLIEAMIKAFRTSQLDVNGIKTEQDLLNRVNEQIRKQAVTQ